MNAPVGSNHTTAQERVHLPSRLRSKDLLSVADVSPEEIVLILDTAEVMKRSGPGQSRRSPR